MKESNYPMDNSTKTLKYMKKIAWISVFEIVLVFTTIGCKFDGVRCFYCLSEDKCITVWKKGNNSVFIILGKYDSVKTPSDNYVKLINITNTVDWYASVIFTKNGKLLIDVVDDNTKAIVQSSKGIIELYNDEKTLNDSLYTCFDGKYRRYKNEVECISIDIKENYATDKTGKKIEQYEN